MAATTIDSLDMAAISTVFRHMPAGCLAAAASVNRDWLSVSSDDRSGLGSWKQLCKWRALAAKRGSNRLWVESDGRGRIVTLGDNYAPMSEVVPPTGSAAYGLQQGAHGTWSPDGRLLVRTTFERRAILGGAFAPAIELISDRGTLVQAVSLDSPYPPTLFSWSPCGTRIAMLSSWHHRKIVLRVMEVPLLPVATEAVRGNGEPLWDARRGQPRMALLGIGRPLSFTWTPDGRSIVALVGGSHLRHFDVDAALAAEADEPDDSSATGMQAEMSPDSLVAPVLMHHPRSSQPEVVVVSACEGGWTVRTASVTNPAARSAELFIIEAPPAHTELVPHHRGKLRVIASPDRQWAAVISGGMSIDVISFSAIGSKQRGDKRHYKISPLVQHCPGIMYPDMAYGHVLAAFWSPDSTRLLIYNDCSFDGLPGQRAWIVWELVDGRSVLSNGQVHLGSGHFESSHLPTLDAYAQAHQLWSPTSDAFCFSAGATSLTSSSEMMTAGQDGAREAGDVSIFVQPVPRWTPDRLETGAAASAASGLDGATADAAEVHVELPLPMEVTSGSLAWWAPN